MPKHVGLCVGSDVAFVLLEFPQNMPSGRHSQGGVSAISGLNGPNLGQLSTLPNRPDSEEFKTVPNFVRRPIFEELCCFKARGILGLKPTLF